MIDSFQTRTVKSGSQLSKAILSSFAEKYDEKKRQKMKKTTKTQTALKKKKTVLETNQKKLKRLFFTIKTSHKCKDFC